MNCLIIDDEPLALDVIRDFCSKVPFLEPLGAFTNPLQAMDCLNRNPIDLIFIDIQMPNITGLEFIKTLPNPPMIIFTTAYSEHALEGFELSAVDYLIKPIPFERFFRAVNKANELYSLRIRSQQPATAGMGEPPENDYLLIKVEYSTVRVTVGDILYVEGLKDYIRIHLPGRTLMTKSTMKNIEQRLPGDKFIRIHKSFIVSLPRINKIENNRIIFGDKWIPVGEHFREKFYALLEKYRL